MTVYYNTLDKREEYVIFDKVISIKGIIENIIEQ